LGQDPIQQYNFRAGLPDLVGYRFKSPLGRGDQQTEDQGSERRDHAGPQLHDILGVTAQMMAGQALAKRHAEQRAAENAD
jgi:hypothetical protein